MAIIEVKKNCFAYDAERRECCICINMICKEKRVCPFYKTQEMLAEARKQSAKRILEISGVDPKVARSVSRYGLSPQRLERIINEGKAAASEGSGTV